MDTIVDVVGAIKFVGRSIHYQELAVLMQSPAQGMTVIRHQNRHLTSLGVLKVPIRANKIATHITFQGFGIFLLYHSGKGTDSFSWRVVVFDHWSILQFRTANMLHALARKAFAAGCFFSSRWGIRVVGILQESLQPRPCARGTCQGNVPKPQDLGRMTERHNTVYIYMYKIV